MIRRIENTQTSAYGHGENDIITPVAAFSAFSVISHPWLYNGEEGQITEEWLTSLPVSDSLCTKYTHTHTPAHTLVGGQYLAGWPPRKTIRSSDSTRKALKYGALTNIYHIIISSSNHFSDPQVVGSTNTAILHIIVHQPSASWGHWRSAHCARLSSCLPSSPLS